MYVEIAIFQTHRLCSRFTLARSWIMKNIAFYRSVECGRRLHSENYRFWLDGISVAVVGSFGFIGNLLALIVLSRPHLRDVFHTVNTKS